MGKQRSTHQKREREMLKRQRQMKKAQKAAEKRERRQKGSEPVEPSPTLSLPTEPGEQPPAG